VKIFILEDDPGRIKGFKTFWGRYFDYATNVEDAKRIVKEKGPFDVFCLDHDLAPEHYVDVAIDPSVESIEAPRIPNGHDFAKWLTENPDVVSENGEIYVHSMNPTGSQNIYDTLVKDFIREDVVVFKKVYHLWLGDKN